MTRAELREVRAMYPAELQRDAIAGEARDLYHVELLAELAGPGGHILDLGGGFAAHNAVLSRRGFDVTVVDSFESYWDGKVAQVDALLGRFAAHGVDLVDADLQSWTPPADQIYDVVFSAHCLEHFHHSPLPMLHRSVARLRLGGTVLICVPNAVNIRKRFAVARGRTNLAPFDEFFLASETFDGHVREFSTDDLRRLGEALGLRNVEIYGKNWLGRSRLSTNRRSREDLAHGMRKILTRSAWGWPVGRGIDVADRVLQTRPGLCTDLYLRGTRGSGPLPQDHP